MLKRPLIFCSKIFVKSQDSGFDAVEAAQEGIVPAMVDQIERKHFSNTFDDFQALIEELKNQSLISSQLLEAQMTKQAKAMVEKLK